jgi:hypothetical protein
MVAGEQGDDPVGFAELVLAQHHRTVPVQPHHISVALRDHIAAYPRRYARRR